jgi:hypothetical protein
MRKHSIKSIISSSSHFPCHSSSIGAHETHSSASPNDSIEGVVPPPPPIIAPTKSYSSHNRKTYLQPHHCKALLRFKSEQLLAKHQLISPPPPNFWPSLVVSSELPCFRLKDFSNEGMIQIFENIWPPSFSYSKQVLESFGKLLSSPPSFCYCSSGFVLTENRLSHILEEVLVNLHAQEEQPFFHSLICY